MKINSKSKILVGFFSWTQANNGSIYLYKTFSGEIIPVTQIEYSNTEIDNNLFEKDLFYIGIVHQHYKTIDSNQFFISMLNSNVSLPKIPLEAWIYFIQCLIYKTSVAINYPIYFKYNFNIDFDNLLVN